MLLFVIFYSSPIFLNYNKLMNKWFKQCIHYFIKYILSKQVNVKLKNVKWNTICITLRPVFTWEILSLRQVGTLRRYLQKLFTLWTICFDATADPIKTTKVNLKYDFRELIYMTHFTSSNSLRVKTSRIYQRIIVYMNMLRDPQTRYTNPQTWNHKYFLYIAGLLLVIIYPSLISKILAITMINSDI